MKLTHAEDRGLRSIMESLATAVRMIERFAENPDDNLGTLLNIREQCWQAARGTTELAATLMERKRLIFKQAPVDLTKVGTKVGILNGPGECGNPGNSHVPHQR